MHTKSKGAALVTSLVLLAALTIVGISAMSATTAQLQVVGNDEAMMDAHERAQSVVDAVLEQNGPFIIQGDAGYTVCNANVSGCSQNTIALTDTIFTESTSIQAKVVLINTNSPMSRGAESSSKTFQSALFTVTGAYDETGSNQGKAEIVQGYSVLVPKSDQGS
jgi:Tfp pilus assembly protein PilX